MDDKELLIYLKEMCPTDWRIVELEAKLSKPKKKKVAKTLEE